MLGATRGSRETKIKIDVTSALIKPIVSQGEINIFMKYIVMSMQRTENKKLNGERICKIKWCLEKTEWKRFM